MPAARVIRRRIGGATLVECVLMLPMLLMLGLAVVQMALLHHAKSQLNYASFEAARAGTTRHARPTAIQSAFVRAMTGYYGGGRNEKELAAAFARAAADLAGGALRIEILSPSRESFTDYESPELSARLGGGRRVIPNLHLDHLRCPRDRPGCNSDPARNASGQSLADANLLKLRVTYGVPPAKQVPVAGRFLNWALRFHALADDADPFRRRLLAAGRLPLVTHITMRMQSEPIEHERLLSLPGPGSLHPADPGPPSPGKAVPTCAVGRLVCGPEGLR